MTGIQRSKKVGDLFLPGRGNRIVQRCCKRCKIQKRRIKCAIMCNKNSNAWLGLLLVDLQVGNSHLGNQRLSQNPRADIEKGPNFGSCSKLPSRFDHTSNSCRGSFSNRSWATHRTKADPKSYCMRSVARLVMILFCSGSRHFLLKKALDHTRDHTCLAQPGSEYGELTRSKYRQISEFNHSSCIILVLSTHHGVAFST